MSKLNFNYFLSDDFDWRDQLQYEAERNGMEVNEFLESLDFSNTNNLLYYVRHKLEAEINAVQKRQYEEGRDDENIIEALESKLLHIGELIVLTKEKKEAA
jgi:hypothetical protein